MPRQTSGRGGVEHVAQRARAQLARLRMLATLSATHPRATDNGKKRRRVWARGGPIRQCRTRSRNATRSLVSASSHWQVKPPRKGKGGPRPFTMSEDGESRAHTPWRSRTAAANALAAAQSTGNTAGKQRLHSRAEPPATHLTPQRRRAGGGRRGSRGGKGRRQAADNSETSPQPVLHNI